MLSDFSEKIYLFCNIFDGDTKQFFSMLDTRRHCVHLLLIVLTEWWPVRNLVKVVTAIFIFCRIGRNNASNKLYLGSSLQLLMYNVL